MFTANVYRVMIGCLGDIMEESFVVQQAVKAWNDANSENRGKVLMPMDWAAGTTDIKNVDVVVAIVGSYIRDTQIVEEAIKAGKRVVLFFSQYHNPEASMATEIKAVEEFKSKVVGHCVSIDYTNKEGIETALNSIFNEL